MVDDEPDARDLLTVVLEARHARVTTVASPAQAYETLEWLSPDVIVSDIGMPGEDGYSFIRKVRMEEVRTQCGWKPAIALTAHARAEDRLRALSAGYQVPFAEKVKKESGITTMTVGLIAGYQQAEDIVASGKADLVCLARAAIWDPRWAWHAAEELGAETPYAPKTMAGHPKLRPQLFPKRAQAAG